MQLSIMVLSIMAKCCYVECQLCRVSVMLRVTYKPFILTDVMLNVVMLNVVVLNVVELFSFLLH